MSRESEFDDLTQSFETRFRQFPDFDVNTAD